MREIVLDTETTGLEASEGHRIIEIGCVELVNRLPTGRTFHTYCNPDRPIDKDATKIHGITDDFVRTMPHFSDVVDDLLEFLGDAAIVAHNAGFDLNFLNAELTLLERDTLPPNRLVDTLSLSRRRF